MATIKMSDVGTKKAMIVWLLANNKCLNCRVPLAFTEFQLDHVTPRNYYHENGKAINHLLENLACLCKSCNSTKQDKGIEFYSDEAQTFLSRVSKWTKGENDIRRFVKKSFVTFDGTTIAKPLIDIVCDTYAKENPKGKFARMHRNGLFYSPIH